MRQKIDRAAAWLHDSSGNVKLSMVIMGAGQFRYGAKGKGILFFLIEVLMVYCLLYTSPSPRDTT